MQNPLNDPAPMTLESFLAWEAQQSDRHEFADGEVFAMSGASKRHNRIVGNLRQALFRHASPGCEVYAESVQLIAAETLHYPDVVLTCDERDEADDYIVRYPRIVAEVLSPSNRGIDVTRKLRAYSTLATLQHVLVIEQKERAVMHYRFSADEGIVHIVRGGVIDVGFPLEIDELYAGIRFGSTA